MVDHHAALLLLADGRLPAGAYAHSGALEPAVSGGRVRTLEDVRQFVSGRLETVGTVTAAFAAAACAAAGDESRLAALDSGLDARMPSPAGRATSRQLGRQLLRVATELRTDERLAMLGRSPHQPLALGLAGAVFELAPHDVASVALHETAAGVVAAAVRLLSIDPLAAHRILADAGPRLDELADRARSLTDADVELLPSAAGPLLDLLAEQHSRREGRLFAS